MIFKLLILQPVAHTLTKLESVGCASTMPPTLLNHRTCSTASIFSYRQARCYGIPCHVPQLATSLLATLGVAYHIGAVQDKCHSYYQQIICML